MHLIILRLTVYILRALSILLLVGIALSFWIGYFTVWFGCLITNVAICLTIGFLDDKIFALEGNHDADDTVLAHVSQDYPAQ